MDQRIHEVECKPFPSPFLPISHPYHFSSKESASALFVDLNTNLHRYLKEIFFKNRKIKNDVFFTFFYNINVFKGKKAGFIGIGHLKGLDLDPTAYILACILACTLACALACTYTSMFTSMYTDKNAENFRENILR